MQFIHQPTFLFTEQQYNEASRYARLKIRCIHCGKQFTRFKWQIENNFTVLKESNRFKQHYIDQISCCGAECKQYYMPTKIIVDCVCGYCGKKFQRPLSRLKYSKSGLLFCHQKCSRNYYKDNDISRSKIDLDWVDDNPTGSFLFTSEQAYAANVPSKHGKRILPCRCAVCGKIFMISLSTLIDYKNKPTSKLNRCSMQCVGAGMRVLEKRETNCAYCGTKLLRDYNTQLHKFINSGHHPVEVSFCGPNCSYCYYKRRGIDPRSNIKQRSKVELYLEQLLPAIFPSLKFVFNDRSVLFPKEIDIWIEQLKIGFELNGIVHYSDDISEQALMKTLNGDRDKLAQAKHIGIEVFSVNTSSLAPFYFRRAKQITKPIIEKICACIGEPPDWDLFDQIERLVEEKLVDRLCSYKNNPYISKCANTSYIDLDYDDMLQTIEQRIEAINNEINARVLVQQAREQVSQ